jgi:hypothetical protein
MEDTSRVMTKSQRWRVTLWLATSAAVGILLSLPGPALAAPPDLTSGGVPDDPRTQNLGPTGARGWVYVTSQAEGTVEARQILVTAIDTGSPAEGILASNDVILGADGTGASAVAFTNDARKALGKAIANAETNSPAVLDLLVWRSGTNMNLQLTLQTMGAYSATAGPPGILREQDIGPCQLRSLDAAGHDQ